MPEFLTPDYAQQFIFPPCLEDWVPAEHPARFVREFVRELADSGLLEASGFGRVKAVRGRPAYAPSLLLAVWLYGYLERIRTTRSLERMCYNNLGALWLTGGLHPDHATLGAFVQQRRPAFRRLFRDLVRTAGRLGLVGMVLHALDGTKIAAQCSQQGAWHRRWLEDRLAALEQTIRGLEEQAAAEERREQGAVGLPEELAHATTCRAQVREALRDLEVARTDHLCPHEPEARIMKGGDGRKTFSYNAQAVRDGESGLVVAAEVVCAETDCAQLPPMLDAVAETLGRTADETVADTGYASGVMLERVEAQGRGVLVNLPRAAVHAGIYPKAQFRWEPDRDCYICPQGHALTRRNHQKKVARRDGTWREAWTYRGTACAGCPVRAQCTGNRTGRTITRSDGEEALERQRQKQGVAAKRALLGCRRAIVERLFAQIKQHEGFRRWTVRGLEAVRCQWAQVTLTVNLRLLLRWWQEGRLSPAALGDAFRAVRAETAG